MAMNLAGFLVIALLAAAPSACTSLRGIDCQDDAELSVLDSIYFGTQGPNRAVSPDDWANFLEHTVTPRFPRGFTVMQASGQWQGADRKILREDSYLLQIVHRDDESADRAVQEIAASYKKRFAQDAVLRVKAWTCASF
jgi:Protein of unknown function (DUF3574)